MAGKSLNKKNLEALGADVLAELLLEVVKGDAARRLLEAGRRHGTEASRVAAVMKSKSTPSSAWVT